MSNRPRPNVHYHYYYPQDTGPSAFGTCLLVGCAVPVGLLLLFMIIGLVATAAATR